MERVAEKDRKVQEAPETDVEGVWHFGNGDSAENINTGISIN